MPTWCARTLTGVKALGADFVDADLRGAVLAEGDFTGAEFTEARMAGVDARRARLGGVSLVDADLRRADLSRADLSHADLRRANLTQGVLAGASFTGAKIEGLTPSGAPAEGLLAGWVDISPAADGSHRLDGRRRWRPSPVPCATPFRPRSGATSVAATPSRTPPSTSATTPGWRSTAAWRAAPSPWAQAPNWWSARPGALLDCQVKGGARLIVHGRVFEREAPAIEGTAAILIGATGSMQGSVAQAAGGTRFGFEKGCKLRLDVGKAPPRPGDAAEPGDGRDDNADGRVRDRMPVMPSSGIATGSEATIVGRGRALHRQPAHRGRHRGARRGRGRPRGPAHRGRGAGRGLGAHEGGRAARLGHHRRARWRRTPSSWAVS